jgi:uncharacterized protein (TIGR03083 family)
MDYERHLLSLRHESAALAAAGRRGTTAAVPSCPGWDVAEVLRHMGVSFRRVARVVRTHSDVEIPDEAVEQPPADGLVEWFEEGVAELADVLSTEEPDSPAWNWSGTDQRAAFWARRMANEVAVHRWDAELAHDAARPIETELAVDGVDELLVAFLASGLAERPKEGLRGTFEVEATDTGDRWTGELWPDRAEVHHNATPLDPPDPAAPPGVLRGSASDLLLALWGRDVRITVEGDERVTGLLLE